MINIKIIRQCIIFIIITTFCAFSPVIIPFIVIILSYKYSLKLMLIISIIYIIWLYIDRKTCIKGGRWSSRFRKCFIWKEWVEYFPLKLIKTYDLDSNKNYIFGVHPHGIGSFGALGNFGSDGTNFSLLFPSIRPHLMLLPIQFFNPITREILLGLGKYFNIYEHK